MASRIEDYAMIGTRFAAPGRRDGSIDWLCWPRFDPDACFAALLGKPEHGRWLIAPKAGSLRVACGATSRTRSFSKRTSKLKRAQRR